MSIPSVPPPPQPCKLIEACLLGLVALLFVAMVGAVVLLALRWGFRAHHLVAVALVGASLLWTGFDLRRQFRVRLTEDGLWSERRGEAVFTPWQGSELWRRGFLVLVRNGAQEGQFNLAIFCTQRPIHEFLARKFPPKG